MTLTYQEYIKVHSHVPWYSNASHNIRILYQLDIKVDKDFSCLYDSCCISDMQFIYPAFINVYIVLCQVLTLPYVNLDMNWIWSF